MQCEDRKAHDANEVVRIQGERCLDVRFITREKKGKKEIHVTMCRRNRSAAQTSARKSRYQGCE